MARLNPSWVPLVKSEALRLVARTADLRAASAFSRSVPLMVAAIDAQPLEVQRALIERAAEHLAADDSKTPNSRFIGGISKSPSWNVPSRPGMPGLSDGSLHAHSPADQDRQRSR